MTYWAHSDPNGLPPEAPQAKWQSLSTHLQNVARISAALAAQAQPGNQSFRDAAQLAGFLHDFGKYTDCFQRMIQTGEGRCPHAAHGAAIAYDLKRPDAAFAIVGHHSGMPDAANGVGSLKTRIKDARTAAWELQTRAASDLPALDQLFQIPGPPSELSSNTFDLRTRMLFSCLVDADRLDSGGQTPLAPPLNPEQRLETLLGHLSELQKKSPDGPVKSARLKVLDDCLNAAHFPGKLFSLTVPTGGGKTLAAMAFALKLAHLSEGRYRRVIAVIPYLSIIEQNADVYTRVFGPESILEHHSGSFEKTRAVGSDHFLPSDTEPQDTLYSPPDRRNATENWSEPLIVTTSVRFFESLFSNRPSDLRRVHNIARSIVILDEVQNLPRSLLAPLLAIIRELTEHWGCAFIFATATQPAFQKRPGALPSRQDTRWLPGTIHEIVQHPADLRTALKRVVIKWELDTPTTWPMLAWRLIRHANVLCVVNLREHAGALYDALLSEAVDYGIEHPTRECFHLSTRMCATHRLVTLAEIRRRLSLNLPCRVISTQLIEAGVDVDFPIGFRALGPLDSIFQVAGRVDREGKLTAALGQPAGSLIVFQSPDQKTPPNDYKEATQRTAALAQAAICRNQPIQPESVEVMETFWQRYYGEADQGQALQGYRLKQQFATLAEQFEMISSRTRDVFVPYDDASGQAIDELRKVGQVTRELRHRLQRYTVGLQPYEFETAKSVLEEVRKDSGIWVAVDRAYTATKGLKISLELEDYITESGV